MEKRNLEDFTKEELIELCEKQELQIKSYNSTSTFWFKKHQSLEKKFNAIKNIIEL